MERENDIKHCPIDSCCYWMQPILDSMFNLRLVPFTDTTWLLGIEQFSIGSIQNLKPSYRGLYIYMCMRIDIVNKSLVTIVIVITNYRYHGNIIISSCVYKIIYYINIICIKVWP